jgi:hypothetical protein
VGVEVVEEVAEEEQEQEQKPKQRRRGMGKDQPKVQRRGKREREQKEKEFKQRWCRQVGGTPGRLHLMVLCSSLSSSEHPLATNLLTVTSNGAVLILGRKLHTQGCHWFPHLLA